MAKNRSIYNAQALFVGATGGGSIVQLHRIQDVSDDWSVARQDVNQYGELAAIDKKINETPTVNLAFSYLATNALNENRLGLVTDFTASAISGLLNTGTNSEKNYYIYIAPEGSDAVGRSALPASANQNQVRGIGNGFLSNITFNGAVGDFAKAQVSVVASNWRVYTGSSGVPTPAIDPNLGSDGPGTFTLPAVVSGLADQPTAISQGDISLSLSGTLGVLASDLKIQSYELSVPLSRTPQQKLGSRFPFNRTLDVPINSTLTISAEVGDLVTGSVSNLICSDPNVNCRITLNVPACPGSTVTNTVLYEIRKAKLVSENFTSSIGPNEQVTITWESSQGNSTDLTAGLFISGIIA